MTLLAPKLFLPTVRPDAVARPRLLEQLTAGLNCRVTLITAPAGFGKTSLLAEWLQAGRQPQHRRVAWLALDQADRTLPRFLAYLDAALHMVLPKPGYSSLAALEAMQPLPVEVVLTAMINQLASQAVQVLLVLDDYHLVDSDSINQALAFLIDHLPAQLHLVIATRSEPHLPLARYRARGQLSELRATDLRFTPGEATELFQRTVGQALTVRDMAALTARTEGWVAGLHLAALALRGQPDPAAFIQAYTGSDRFVLDYLVAEVLDRQPPERMQFMLATALLNRLCGPLCDAVLEVAPGTSQPLLEAIEQANLFLFPLDHERRWYRYHQLFAEVLQQRLLQNSDWDLLQAYHQRASAWYAQHAMVHEAFHHAVATGDQVRLAVLAEQTWAAMDAAFQTVAWLAWVQRLPEATITTRPILCIQYAMVLIDQGQLDSSTHYLQIAEDLLERNGQADPVIGDQQVLIQKARIALARAQIAQARGDTATAVAQAETAHSLVPETEPLLRAQAAVLVGMASWTRGALDQAYQAVAEWSSSMQRLGKHSFAIAPAFVLADIRTEQGRLRAAITIYTQALQQAVEYGAAGQPFLAHLNLGLAMLYHETGQPELAAPLLERSQALAAQSPMPDWPVRWLRAQAQLKADQADYLAALELLDQAERQAFPTPVPAIRPIAALKARIALQQGQLRMVQAWAAAAGIAADDPLSYLREYEHMLLARLRIAEYVRTRTTPALREALGLLARLLDSAESGGRFANLIEILLIQAQAYLASAQHESAYMALERALLLAEPEGYIQVFIREGPTIAQLLSALAARGIAEQYCRRLLVALGQLAASGQALLAEPLSERELEVLRLVAQGLSNQQIAERLNLAVSSVKGHNLRIFSKLQVQRRTEAIARARELGLV